MTTTCICVWCSSTRRHNTGTGHILTCSTMKFFIVTLLVTLMTMTTQAIRIEDAIALGSEDLVELEDQPMEEELVEGYSIKCYYRGGRRHCYRVYSH